MIPLRETIVPLFLLVHGCIGWSAFLAASTINHPASKVPAHGVEPVSSVKKNSDAKSKVVPVKRTLDLATSGAKPKAEKFSKTTPRGTVSNAELNKPAKRQRSVNPVVVPDENTWDSAAKRYDQNGAANAVTGGVRVEDIIEPTFDYQYSSGRRKNPFIPEVILTGKIARQRELSPNDVEIPIVSPLQSFGLRELAVIGVWETENSVWKALIKTPATQGIEAKLGDPIGNSGGRVMAISPDAVIVREFSVRTDGTREYRDMPLYMGSDAPTPGAGSVGGRLILKPGATKPELMGPDTPNRQEGNSTISTSATITPGAIPGTLKTTETILAPVADERSDQKSEVSGAMVPTGTTNSIDPTGPTVPTVPNNEQQPQQVNPSSGGKQ